MQAIHFHQISAPVTIVFIIFTTSCKTVFILNALHTATWVVGVEAVLALVSAEARFAQTSASCLFTVASRRTTLIAVTC